MYLRSKNAVLLIKIEGSEGSDASPASTDAVKVENPRLSDNINLITTNEVTGSLDGSGPIVGGMRLNLAFDMYLKGSGAAASAPEFGKLLKICGLGETITSTAVPSSAEACGAGGSTTIAQLGSSASSTAGAYAGMPLTLSSEISANTFIAAYDASKNATLVETMTGAVDADSNYQVPVNVRYAPASASIPSATGYLYMDGIVYKIVGLRGTVSIDVQTGGVGKMSFNLTGLFSEKADASVPASPTYDGTRPPVFRNAVMKLNRGVAAIRSFRLDFGNRLTNPDNPNTSEGFDVGIITERAITGSIDPAATLVATRDIMTDLRAGTERIAHLRYGSVAGNRVAITVPKLMATSATPGDREGIVTEEVSFAANGQDSGFYLTFY